MPRAAAPSRTYLPGLDGLRGVAALAVFGSHFENLSGLDLGLKHSGTAVDFFFVLSGFVIGQAYEPRLRGGMSLRGYMSARLKRLYPSILAGLVLGIVGLFVAGEPFSWPMLLQLACLPVLFGPRLHGGEAYPLDGPQWSLGLELGANALHAALLPRLSDRVLAGMVTICAASLAAISLTHGGLDLGWSRETLLFGLPRVGFGFTLGVWFWRRRAAGVRAPVLPYPLLAAVLVLTLWRPWPETGGPALWDAVVVIAVMPTLVWLALDSPPGRVLTSSAGFLGALSYPLYAVHAPLLRLAAAAIGEAPDNWARSLWPAAAVAVILAAAAFERWADRPLRGWLSR